MVQVLLKLMTILFCLANIKEEVICLTPGLELFLSVERLIIVGDVICHLIGRLDNVIARVIVHVATCERGVQHGFNAQP